MFLWRPDLGGSTINASAFGYSSIFFPFLKYVSRLTLKNFAFPIPLITEFLVASSIAVLITSNPYTSFVNFAKNKEIDPVPQKR